MVHGETSLHEKSVILLTWPTWSKKRVSAGSAWRGIFSSFWDDYSDYSGIIFPAIDESSRQIFSDSALEAKYLLSNGENCTDSIEERWPVNS